MHGQEPLVESWRVNVVGCVTCIEVVAVAVLTGVYLGRTEEVVPLMIFVCPEM